MSKSFNMDSNDYERSADILRVLGPNPASLSKSGILQ